MLIIEIEVKVYPRDESTVRRQLGGGCQANITASRMGSSAVQMIQVMPHFLRSILQIDFYFSAMGPAASSSETDAYQICVLK